MFVNVLIHQSPLYIQLSEFRIWTCVCVVQKTSPCSTQTRLTWVGSLHSRYSAAGL